MGRRTVEAAAGGMGMKGSVFFVCENCGERVRTFDGRNHRFGKEDIPLRKLLGQRKQETGRLLCGSCYRKTKQEDYK